MISGYYEEINLSDGPVIAGLNRVIETINYDRQKVDRNLFRENVTVAQALDQCSESTLEKLRQTGSRDVATKDCNLLKFNNVNFDFLGKEIAKVFADKLQAYGISGRIWYPPAGYMGWHTNDDNRGFKFYCTFAREGQKSFFRYRNPETGDIITAWDKKGWNFRLFKVTENLLWHCVFSETDRFSIGYTFFPK